jgi:hypothetical protein
MKVNLGNACCWTVYFLMLFVHLLNKEFLSKCWVQTCESCFSEFSFTYSIGVRGIYEWKIFCKDESSEKEHDSFQQD